MKLFPIVFVLILNIQINYGQDLASSFDSDAEFSPTNKGENEWVVTLNHSNLLKEIEKNKEEEPFTSDILQQRLEILSNNTPFNVAYNPTVERIIRLYLEERKDVMANLMDKAQYFFPIFEECLDKYNLPLELKYMAIVESALEPDAKSVAGARGLWQFMYHTGKQYGLKVSSYVDERADPIKATEAACKYLKDLYDIFNDWDLALAAYNSGPGNVNKAIYRAGGKRNFWNIRQYLPAETRGYVPAFYATFYLFEYGKEHNITPKNMRITYFDTDTIHVKKQVKLARIQELLNIDRQLLDQLNPQYKMGIIPYTDGNTVLTLPKGYIERFVAVEPELYGISLTEREQPIYIIPNKDNSYTVQEGDNLARIAKKFNITTLQLKQWSGLQTDFLIKGQRLVISGQKPSQEKPSPVEAKEETTTEYSYATYVVQEGDSLFLIAKKFDGININDLRTWNNLWGVNYVSPGTLLKIRYATP